MQSTPWKHFKALKFLHFPQAKEFYLPKTTLYFLNGIKRTRAIFMLELLKM